MKRNNRISIFRPIAVALFGLAVAACTGNFEDINRDPNAIGEDQRTWDFNHIGGFIPQMEADIIPTSDVTANDYQRAQNLTGDIFSGHQAAIGEWNGSVNNSTYYLGYDKWNDVGFEVAYKSVMSGWLQIKKKASEEFPHVVAMATIIKVASMHRITDNYGPIPYSQFGNGVKLPYDSQRDIYFSFFKELKSSIDTLKKFLAESPGAKPMAKFDLIYQGDYAQWIKYANSLKLRLAMRIRFAEPDSAKKYALEAITDGVFASNADNAVLKSYRGIQVVHPLKTCWDAYTDVRMGASMDGYMNGYADNRRASYFNPGRDPQTQATGFFGVRNGLPDHNKQNFLTMSTPNIETTTPVMLMTAAEVQFLKAEAAIKGWYTDETAQSLYEKGVTFSFQQWGAGGVSEYLAQATVTAVNFNFTDHSNDASKKNIANSYLGTLRSVAWVDTDVEEVKLQRIITQKWIALYPDGQEAWSEMRRTAYPKIYPIQANNSGGVITSNSVSNTGVKRVIYPTTEYSGNNVNVTKAIVTLGQESKPSGAVNDTGAVKVWWDKKP